MPAFTSPTSPGAAESYFRRLEKRNTRSAFSKMKGRRQPGISAANHDDIRCRFTGKGSSFRRWWRSQRPQSV
ncbi:hypothetical protein ACVWZR_002488 [Bradyrhizobium sp. i1.3.1]